MALTTSEFFADIQSSRGDYILKDHTAALSQRHDVVAKAAQKGAGSRGGHIIGHTRSGKAVYAASSSHYAKTRRPMERMSTSSPITHTHMMAAKGALNAHEGWSAEDHRDAAKIHEVTKLMSGSAGEKASAGHVAFAHRNAANWLGKSAMRSVPSAVSTSARLTDLAKSEGSRGGHIIGHTKSGKAIYGH